MKKINILFRGITLMFFLMFSLSSYSQACDYTLEMNDSFGDGWNGATMDVVVQGTLVLDNVSASGSGTTLTFPVEEGSTVNAFMNSGGSFPGEITWTIFDSEDNSVFSGNAFSSTTFNATCPAACPGVAVVNSATVSPDCNNQQYYVDVDFASGGNATHVSDGTTLYPILSGSGVLQVGPFASNTTVNLSVIHSPTDCNFDLDPLSYICPPPNDTCGTALALSCGTPVTGSTEAASSESLASCGTFISSTTPGVWYTIQGTGGEIILSTADSNYDTKLGLYSGACGALVCLDGDDDGGPGLTSEITFSSDASTTYYVYVTGFSGNSGTYVLSTTCRPIVSIDGDSCITVYSSSFAPLASTTLTAVGAFGDTSAPYEYVWSDGQMGATIDITPAANTVYEVTLTDASGDTATAQVSVLVVDVSCTNGGNQAKVLLCHDGNEICVSPNAVQAHLNHGDSIGSCEVATVGTCDTPPVCDSVLKVPAANAIDVPTDIEISWGEATGLVAGYLLSVGTTSGGGEVIDGLDVGLNLDYSLDGLLDFSTTYYVTVVPYNDNGEGSGCESVAFTSEASPWSVATAVACGGSATGDISAGSVNDYLSFCGGTINDTPGVWYSFVGDGYDIIVSLCSGTSFDSILAVYEGDGTAISCLAGNDDECGLVSEVEVATTAGETYYVYITPWSSFTTSGTYTLTITCPGPPPVNQACNVATSIGCGDTVSDDTGNYISNDFDFCGTSLDSSGGVFYKFEGNGDDINVNTFGSSFDTKLGVFSSSDCIVLTCVGGNDDTGGAQSSVDFTSEVGTVYYIYVTGFGSSTGVFLLNLTCIAPPPAPECDGQYVDSGGIGGSYGNNELTITTIVPDVAGDAVTVTFTYVDIEATSFSSGIQDGCWDFLTIYDGPNTSSPVLAQTLCGEENGDGNVPGTASSLLSVGDSFTSTHASGALTIVFDSDGSITETGWIADITCASARIAADWSLYPNPATNGEIELDLSLYLNMDLEIQMLDYSGKMLINNAESNLQNPRYRMNTQNASSGLYFVRIVTESGISTKKLIISN